MHVWVTRDEAPDGTLSTALQAVGLEAVHEPVLRRRVVDDCAEVIGGLGADDWLVLTSKYAIESVAAGPSRKPQVAVVGEPSREAATAKGFRVALVSGTGDGEGLWSALRQKVRRGRVCYPRSSLAKAPDRWSGVELMCPVLYETVSREFDRGVIERVEMVAVASPSAVEAIREAKVDLRRRPFASIGPTTSAALRKHEVEPAVEAPSRSFQSLAEAIAAYGRAAEVRG